MALEGGVLARIDRRLLKELTDEPGTQLVKVPVSPAVWSTWRRYCEIVGLTMGAALAALLRRELESVVDSDPASDAPLFEQRSQELDERESLLADRELLLRAAPRVSPLPPRHGAIETHRTMPLLPP